MNGWAAAWVTWMEHEKDLEPSTRKLYQRTLQGLERDLAGSRSVEKLQTKDLLTWLQRKGGSPSSYANRIAALRSFYGYLFAERGFLTDPSQSLDLPKREPSPREPVRDLQTKLSALDQQDQQVGRRVGESRDMAWFLAQTGVRISDACKLSLKTPVPAKLIVSHRRRPDKIVELSDEAQAALNRLGGRFGIGPRALQRRFEKAGFHPDQLRHWYRVNIQDRDLRDRGNSPLDGDGGATGAGIGAANSDARLIPDGTPTTPVVDSLTAIGRFLRLAEDVTGVLIREARGQGKSWEDIAQALSISESAARERFAG